MIEGKDREDTIRLTARVLRIPTSEAEMMYAIEHGEIPPTGDVQTVDDERPKPKEGDES